MKTRPLKNYSGSIGVEVYDIDLTADDDIIELGHIVADNCVVFVDQSVETRRLYDIMTQWGDPSRALIHNYIISQRLSGRHWRDLFLHLGYINNGMGELAGAVSRVSYLKDDRGRPKGIFSNGELDWHSDQCAFDDAPRTIGLMSVSDSAGSQTQFMPTHDQFMELSSDMQSMIKELIVKHKWREGNEGPAPGLNREQTMIIHYNGIPIDGMETSLYRETVTGRPGVKFPPFDFDGFVGMSDKESWKLYYELKKHFYNPKYVYTQDWQDGQIVFMDQEITLHKRPTNIQAGDKRMMHRVISYLNKIYPNIQPASTVRHNSKIYTHDEFAKLVDEDRRKKFEEEQVELAY
jgi:alpha-ketoglutarate-dependent taurine dioxygenase